MKNQQKINILTLNRLKVLNEKNESILISSLWKDNPVVLIFIRHFGCISCRSHVDQVWNRREDFKKKGVELAFIGSGDPYLISTFKQDFKLESTPIYTDPSLATFEACGLRHIDTKNLDVKSMNAISLLEKRGYELKLIKDDGSDTQLGGVVAIKPPGIVTYHFVSDYIGDFDGPTSSID